MVLIPVEHRFGLAEEASKRGVVEDWRTAYKRGNRIKSNETPDDDIRSKGKLCITSVDSEPIALLITTQNLGVVLDVLVEVVTFYFAFCERHMEAQSYK